MGVVVAPCVLEASVVLLPAGDVAVVDAVVLVESVDCFL
jgi:hypothetical protein